ncbi:MAG: hypothetical protein BJ554DRAFT_2728, partial [Olpidium bornovanus]
HARIRGPVVHFLRNLLPKRFLVARRFPPCPTLLPPLPARRPLPPPPPLLTFSRQLALRRAPAAGTSLPLQRLHRCNTGQTTGARTYGVSPTLLQSVCSCAEPGGRPLPLPDHLLAAPAAVDGPPKVPRVSSGPSTAAPPSWPPHSQPVVSAGPYYQLNRCEPGRLRGVKLCGLHKNIHEGLMPVLHFLVGFRIVGDGEVYIHTVSSKEFPHRHRVQFPRLARMQTHGLYRQITSSSKNLPTLALCIERNCTAARFERFWISTSGLSGVLQSPSFVRAVAGAVAVPLPRGHGSHVGLRVRAVARLGTAGYIYTTYKCLFCQGGRRGWRWGTAYGVATGGGAILLVGPRVT